MIKFLYYSFTCIPLLFLASCGREKSENRDNVIEHEMAENDKKAIKQIASGFASAWNNHDPAAMAAFWTDDGDLLTVWEGALIKGKSAIRSHFAQVHAEDMKDSNIQFEIEKIRFVDPDTAFVDADLTISNRTVNGKKAVPFRNHAVFLLVKKDYIWQIFSARPY